MPPVEFPPVLPRHTIPPIQGQLVNQTKVPVYMLGWIMTRREFTIKYREAGSTPTFCRLLPCLTLAPRYYAPDIMNKGFDGDYLLYIIGNGSERHLRKAVDDEFVKTAMKFLDQVEPPQWFHMS
ncbi:hypothetical protein AURDEDRAFT_58505 [Auricularia subglabra TFB-10046 SS5]|nr:hypothetical protein AURDEDRAFT_58505 [Auricularia subglabra TFB-10046 SS5]